MKLKQLESMVSQLIQFQNPKVKTLDPVNASYSWYVCCPHGYIFRYGKLANNLWNTERLNHETEVLVFRLIFAKPQDKDKKKLKELLENDDGMLIIFIPLWTRI